VVAATYVYHGPGLEVSGPDAIRGVFAMLREAFPDWHETLEDMIAEGDKVVFRVTGHGTHQGEFFGIPATGTRVTMGGLDLVHVERGRFVEHWANFDQFGLMQQLGAIPAPEQPTG
jgi:predicted ester cyclase